jgi:hypothetical protein
MARKLKTYQTSLGFFDLAMAAPSMKAALEAWGERERRQKAVDKAQAALDNCHGHPRARASRQIHTISSEG